MNGKGIGKSREAERIADGGIRWLAADETISEITIRDDGILLAYALLPLLALHLQLKGGFATRDRRAVPVEHRALFGLPPAATRGLAKHARASKRVSVKLAIRPLELGREREMACSEDALLGGATGGGCAERRRAG